MDTLQTICCRKFLSVSPVGTVVPYTEIPGTSGSWVRAWASLVNVPVAPGVIDMVRECLETGAATRIHVDNNFRREVHTICESMGLCHGPKNRKRKKYRGINYADMTISKDAAWVWKIGDLKSTGRRWYHHQHRVKSGPRKTLDEEYPKMKQMVRDSLGAVASCEPWEDKTEKLIWDGMALEISSLPAYLRGPCVDRLKRDGLLEDSYVLW
jgi:hypothetical protein